METPFIKEVYAFISREDGSERILAPVMENGDVLPLVFYDRALVEELRSLVCRLVVEQSEGEIHIAIRRFVLAEEIETITFPLS